MGLRLNYISDIIFSLSKIFLQCLKSWFFLGWLSPPNLPITFLNQIQYDYHFTSLLQSFPSQKWSLKRQPKGRSIFFSPICVGYQYQQFGILFGVKPIHFQYQIDLATPSSGKIDFRKTGFWANFWSLRRPFTVPVKYTVRKATHKWKIWKNFFTKSIATSSHPILMTTIWKSIYFNKSKRL